MIKDVYPCPQCLQHHRTAVYNPNISSFSTHLLQWSIPIIHTKGFPQHQIFYFFSLQDPQFLLQPFITGPFFLAQMWAPAVPLPLKILSFPSKGEFLHQKPGAPGFCFSSNFFIIHLIAQKNQCTVSQCSYPPLNEAVLQQFRGNSLLLSESWY